MTRYGILVKREVLKPQEKRIETLTKVVGLYNNKSDAEKRSRYAEKIIYNFLKLGFGKIEDADSLLNYSVSVIPVVTED